MSPAEEVAIFCLVILALCGVVVSRMWLKGEVGGEQAIEYWFKGFSYCLGGIVCFWLGSTMLFGGFIYLVEWLGG